MLRHVTRSPLFPYTTLFRSRQGSTAAARRAVRRRAGEGAISIGVRGRDVRRLLLRPPISDLAADVCEDTRAPRDRKSTRLNSSHSQISYAVFCLKKKRVRFE